MKPNIIAIIPARGGSKSVPLRMRKLVKLVTIGHNRLGGRTGLYTSYRRKVRWRLTLSLISSCADSL